MFVGKLAMFESRSGVLLRLFVLAKIVVMGRLMMMMSCAAHVICAADLLTCVKGIIPFD